MHRKPETELRQLARDCVTNHGDEAWEIFRTEAYARYAAEDDGPRSRYGAKCVNIFEAERFALRTDPNTHKPAKKEAAIMRDIMGIPPDHPLPVVINAPRDAVLTIKPDAEITITKHGFRVSGDDMVLNELH
jgi:hypothetical protein